MVCAHIPRVRQPRRITKPRCLRRIDSDALKYDLTIADWGQVFAAPTVSLKWEGFSFILSVFDVNVPVRTFLV